MVEEGRSRKQHLLSILFHVSRWERNRVETQKISSESLHSPSSLKGLFLILFSTRWKTTPSLILFTHFPTKLPWPPIPSIYPSLLHSNFAPSHSNPVALNTNTIPTHKHNPIIFIFYLHQNNKKNKDLEPSFQHQTFTSNLPQFSRIQHGTTKT